MTFGYIASCCQHWLTFKFFNFGISVTVDGTYTQALNVFKLKGHMIVQEKSVRIFTGVVDDRSEAFLIERRSYIVIRLLDYF